MKNLEVIDLSKTSEISNAITGVYQRDTVGEVIREEMFLEVTQFSGYRINHRGDKWIEPDFPRNFIQQLLACEIFPDLDCIHIASGPHEIHEDIRRRHNIPNTEPRISGDLLFLLVDGIANPCAIKIDTVYTPFGAKTTTDRVIENLKSSGYLVFGPTLELL